MNKTFTDLYVLQNTDSLVHQLISLVLFSVMSLLLFSQEVDIWSFGCLIFELLTLQNPYFDLSELQIHESLQVCLTFTNMIEIFLIL